MIVINKWYTFSYFRYRWAFVGSQYDNISSDFINGTDDMQFASSTSPLFIPHVRRIARLMDLRFTSHSPVCCKMI